MFHFYVRFLGGGFKYVLCSPLPGEMIQIDDHIFQMGWNHHLDSLYNHVLHPNQSPRLAWNDFTKKLTKTRPWKIVGCSLGVAPQGRPGGFATVVTVMFVANTACVFYKSSSCNEETQRTCDVSNELVFFGGGSKGQTPPLPKWSYLIVFTIKRHNL